MRYRPPRFVQNDNEWTLWFAWRPVRTNDGQVVFFEYVWRKSNPRHTDPYYDDSSYWEYEVREKLVP